MPSPNRPARLGSRALAVLVLCTLVLAAPAAAPAQGAKPSAGELRWALHVTLAARWLDPAETEAFSTPFMVMYAVHDAMLRPMPAGLTTPSLAESWAEAKDHLSYTFVLRKGVRFLLTGPTADALRKAPGFRLAAPLVSGAFWLELPEQGDPKSP